MYRHRGVPPEQQASIEHLTLGALDQLLPILQRRCSSAEVARGKATQAAQDASRCTRTRAAIARCEIVETALNGICDACAEYPCLTSVVRTPEAESTTCRICGADVEAYRAPPPPPRGAKGLDQLGTLPSKNQDLWHLWERQVISQHAQQKEARKRLRQQQVQKLQEILSRYVQQMQQTQQTQQEWEQMQRQLDELEAQPQHTQDHSQYSQLTQLRTKVWGRKKYTQECDERLVQALSQERLMYLTTATLPLKNTLYDDDEQEFTINGQALPSGMRALDPPRSVRQEQLHRARFERQVMQERLDSAAQLAANAVAVEERARALVDWATARRAQLQADLETAADRRRQQQLAVAQAEMEAVRKRVAQLGGATDKASGALSTAPRRSEISASQECPVCFQSPRDCGLQCGHQLCMQCAHQVQQCPVCRQEISLRLKLYH